MSTLDRWREEKQSAWIYRRIAPYEKAEPHSKLYTLLADAADEQAGILEGDLRAANEPVPAFAPSLRARLVAGIARVIGPERARPMLAALKVRGLSAYSSSAPRGHVMPTSAENIGRRHKRGGSTGTLRAAVFGVNDGVVSNTCLVLGVAGAEANPRTILMTGVAGLLAGACSMAAGEYVSMRSQRELFENQIGEEREELERYPDEEAEELALIYEARGVPIERAREMTRDMLKDKERLLDTLAREELGLNPDDLGSPWGAALSSLCAFAMGALIPLIPFVWTSLGPPVWIAAILAGACLFLVGVVLALFSGRNALYGGARMLLIGLFAGVATWGIGRWIGVGMAG